MGIWEFPRVAMGIWELPKGCNGNLGVGNSQMHIHTHGSVTQMHQITNKLVYVQHKRQAPN